MERLADRLYYDFNDGTFKATPTTLISPLPEGVGNFLGCYDAVLTPTPASQFTDGDYAVTVHNTAASNAAVGRLGSAMFNGSDATDQPLLVFKNFFISGIISAVTSASQFTVAFADAASTPAAAGLANLWCYSVQQGRAPQKQQISIATVVDSTHLSITLLIAFATTPVVNDSVAIG